MMANDEKNKKIISPNILGASVLFGIIIGASISGFIGQFELWIPIFGAIGLILGLYLKRSEEQKISEKDS